MDSRGTERATIYQAEDPQTMLHCLVNGMSVIECDSVDVDH